MNNKLVILGGGGHAKVVIDAAHKNGQFDIVGIVDPFLDKGQTVLDVPVLGPDDVLAEIFSSGIENIIIGVGSVGECSLRKELYRKVKKIGFALPSVVHPSAVIARDVSLEEGVFIAASSTVNPGTIVGKNAILNTSSSIDHDCVIGDFVHIAPGVTLSGDVRIGHETHIGTGAIVCNSTAIPDRYLVKSGSLVYQNTHGELIIKEPMKRKEKVDP